VRRTAPNQADSSLDPASSVVLGFDVGGTQIRSGVYDGHLVRLLDPQPTPQDYPAFLECLERLYHQASSLVGPPQALGLGLPGIWRDETIQWVPNIDYLAGQRLIPNLERRWQLKAVIANDAQMALLGEVWQGAARQCQSATLLSLGTGIGGAILVGGRVVRGAHGSAGAFGWLSAGPDDPGDQDHGPLERQASGTALERLGRELRPPRSAHQVVEEARLGVVLCQELIGLIAARLGAGIAGLVSALDPAVLILCGGLSEAFDLLEAPMRASLERLASPNGRQVPIRVAVLGTNAGVYGAIHAARAEGEVFC
jgi:predicted NBD/HSP70 family sugar kinase